MYGKLGHDMMVGILVFFNTYGLALELLLSCGIFTWHLKRRKGFWLRVLCACAGLLCVSLLWGMVQPHSILWQSIWYILLLAGCLLIVIGCFCVSIRQAVFYVIAAGAAQHLVFKAGRTCEYCIYELLGFQPEIGIRPRNDIQLRINVIVYPLWIIPFFLMCWLIFARRLRQVDAEGLQHTYVSVPLVGMLLCTDLFQCLYDEYTAILPFQVSTLLNVSAIMTCLFILGFLCETAERGKEEQSNAILRHMLHQQKEQLAASKETIELINIKCHDVKNQLAMLGDQVLPETIEDLNRTLTIYDGVPRTGSEALDVLLAEKTLQCQRKEIRFDYMADGACLSFVNPADIYSLLGNALNNAVEAAVQCPDPNQRYIQMRLAVEKGVVMIHLENSFCGSLDFDGELPRTTKQDKLYHGFGMKSIQLITQRYHGYLRVNSADQIFTLNILLPVPA